MTELDRQFTAARSFDPDNFGTTQAVTGTYAELDSLFKGTNHCTKNELIEQVVTWILDQ